MGVRRAVEGMAEAGSVVAWSFGARPVGGRPAGEATVVAGPGPGEALSAVGPVVVGPGVVRFAAGPVGLVPVEVRSAVAGPAVVRPEGMASAVVGGRGT
ncbi:hypothetical protein ACWV95_13525 [Streptomyces albus]